MYVRTHVEFFYLSNLYGSLVSVSRCEIPHGLNRFSRRQKVKARRAVKQSSRFLISTRVCKTSKALVVSSTIQSTVVDATVCENKKGKNAKQDRSCVLLRQMHYFDVLHHQPCKCVSFELPKRMYVCMRVNTFLIKSQCSKVRELLFSLSFHRDELWIQINVNI